MTIKHKFRYDFITRASAEFEYQINQNLKTGYVKWEYREVDISPRFVFTFVSFEERTHIKFLEIILTDRNMEVFFESEEPKIFDTSDKVVSYLSNLRVSEKFTKRLNFYPLLAIHEA